MVEQYSWANEQSTGEKMHRETLLGGKHPVYVRGTLYRSNIGRQRPVYGGEALTRNPVVLQTASIGKEPYRKTLLIGKHPV